MKPLLLVKITPATREGLGDYQTAKDHLTDDGRLAFWQRQRARIKDAQAQQSAKITPIHKAVK